MVEAVTFIQSFAIFTTGMTIGFSIGYKFSNKTVTSADTFCNTPDNSRGSIGIKAIFANGKQTGVTCFYKQNNGICEWTSQKCKYL